MATLYERTTEYNEMMEEKGLNIGIATFMLDEFVNGKHFFERLDDILNKRYYQCNNTGMIFSDDYPKGKDGYFGENKVLFYVPYFDDDEDNEEILDNEEFYKYLKATCEFYIKYHPDEKDKVMDKLQEIEKVFLLK